MIYVYILRDYYNLLVILPQFNLHDKELHVLYIKYEQN